MTKYSSQKRAPAPVYVATTTVIFFLSLSAADSVGFVPCYVDGSECHRPVPRSSGIIAHGGSPEVELSALPELGSEVSKQRTENDKQEAITTLPERIVISVIDLDLPVQNPETRDLEMLDEYLKDGPVRYMDSAKLGEKGNVLVFAHTSHLPVVKNQMYKAFNRLPELKAGDTITMEGEGRSYIYSVVSVRTADAEEAVIDLSPSIGQKLTLVTCDTLTGKSARFVLEADFIAAL